MLKIYNILQKMEFLKEVATLEYEEQADNPEEDKEARERGYKEIYLKTTLNNYYEKFGAIFVKKISDEEKIYKFELQRKEMSKNMLHKMKLNQEPFEKIKNGTKTVEFRLYDEKRRTVQIGDEIEFSKLPELQEKLLVKVIDLYKEESFAKLFKKVFAGGDENEVRKKAESMYKFYTPETEKEYGVVGIKIEVIK